MLNEQYAWIFHFNIVVFVVALRFYFTPHIAHNIHSTVFTSNLLLKRKFGFLSKNFYYEKNNIKFKRRNTFFLI